MIVGLGLGIAASSHFVVSAAAEVIRVKKGITAIGNAQIDTAQSKFGGSSALFDGSSDYLNVDPSSNFNFGTNDFTIEGWVRFSSVSGTRVFYDKREAASGTGGPLLYYSGTFIYYGGGGTRISGGTAVVDTWYHWAVSRSSGTTKMFINGTQVGSTYTDSINYSTTSTAYIGSNRQNNSDSWAGWIDEVRISNTARYTANFTPSTTPFVNDENTLLLLHMDGTDTSTVFEDDNGIRAPKGVIALGNAQIDTAQSKFGGTSAYFDGVDDRLETSILPELNFGTGDFTLECWFRTTTIANQVLICAREGASLSPVELRGNVLAIVNGKLAWSNGSAWNYTTTDYSTNTWYHAAVTRSSGTLRIFLNGVKEHESTQSQSFIGNRKAVIGAFENAVTFFNGHLDEVRISNTARYTANFTPSTTPFQNDDNTLLLLHMDGTDGSTVFTDDVGVRSKKGITASGNAQIDTAQSKFGGSSLLLSGTDRIQTSTSEAFTGDFTMEVWVRFSSLAGQYQVIINNGTTETNPRVNILMNYSTIWVSIATQPLLITGSQTLSTNTWYHLALVRSGSTVTLYKDGTSIGTATNSNTLGLTNGYTIGPNSSQTSSWAGWVDEVRVSNTARYTANFTPSTTPFQNDDNTILLLHMDGTDGSTVFTDDNGVTPNYNYGA